MNLLINNYCNLKCSYCFAHDTMYKEEPMNITMDNFVKYLNWLKKSGTRSVRLIGGEPTLNPDLEKLIDKVIEYNFFEHILIFSNFTFPPEVTNMFVEKSRKIQLLFLPNINELDLLLPNMKERILYNLDVLSTTVKHFKTIGVNIYDPNMSLAQWEELLCRYNLGTLRFSIVLPNSELPADFNYYDFFHSYQDVLLQLCDISEKYGVFLSCDCNGLPICCYDDDVVVRLLKVCPEIFGKPFCDSVTIDIKPDLMINGCFGVGTTLKKYVTDFNNEEEIYEYYAKEKMGRISGVVREECYKCPRYLKNGQCCSCFAYRREFKKC